MEETGQLYPLYMAKTKQGMPEAQFRAMQARYDKNRVPHVTVAGVESKSCSRCAKVKPLDQFGQDLNCWDKLQAECRKCREEFWAADKAKKRERKSWTPRLTPKVGRAEEEERIALTAGWREINERLRKRAALESIARAKVEREQHLYATVPPEETYKAKCGLCGKISAFGLTVKQPRCPKCGSGHLDKGTSVSG